MHQFIEIRMAERSDIDALSELAIRTYTAAFGHTFSAPDLASHLERNLAPSNFSRIVEEDVILLAEAKNRLIGYVQFGAAKNGSEAAASGDQELRRIYVHPDFQNQGIGTRLMEAALAHPRLRGAENIYLDVWEYNQGAQRFYQRYGFEVIGARIFDVESGAETDLDLIMVRRSSPLRPGAST
jgi:ribosomal protein S18 acetylase RimI-like enzyme